MRFLIISLYPPAGSDLTLCSQKLERAHNFTRVYSTWCIKNQRLRSVDDQKLRIYENSAKQLQTPVAQPTNGSDLNYDYNPDDYNHSLETRENFLFHFTLFGKIQMNTLQSLEHEY